MGLRNLTAIVFAGAILLSQSPAFARWEVNRTINIRFEVPDAWVTTTQGNVVVTRPAAGGVAVEFIAIENAGQQAAAEAGIRTLLATRLNNVQVVGTATPVTQRGLRGLVIRGTGARDGRVVEWFAAGLGASGRGILALGFAAQGQLAANLPTVRAILDSIQPVEAVANVTLSGTYAGNDSTTMAMTMPARPQETHAGTGHVQITDNGGPTFTVTLLDERGGPPCGLTATRNAAGAVLTAGQACSDSRNGNLMTITIANGTVMMNGAVLVLNFSGTLQGIVTTPQGQRMQVAGNTSYQFNGQRQ